MYKLNKKPMKNSMQYPGKEKFVSPRTRGKLTISEFAKRAAQKLDKHFPRMDVPPLHCFNLGLDKEEQSTAASERQHALQKMRSSRELHLNQTRQMYQMAQTHKSVTNRLLDKYEDELDLAFNGSELSQVIPGDQLYEPETAMHYSRWLRNRRILPIREESNLTSVAESSLQRNESAAQRSRTDSLTVPPDPLTMKELYDTETIKEAKCTSSLWTNYLRAACKD